MSSEVNLLTTHFSISRRHWKFLRGALIFLYILAFPVSFYHYAIFQTWDYVGMDYPFFYNAGRNLLAGQTPYPLDVVHHEPGADRAWGKYVYPPLYGWIIAPTTGLSELLSKKVYVYTCILLYFFFFVPWKTKLKTARLERWAAFALLCIWGPTVETFRFGQSNPVTFLALFAACCLVEKLPPGDTPSCRRWIEILAGALVGLATMIKLTPIVILPVLLVSRRWRIATGYVLGIVLTLLLTGIRTNYEYFTVVLPTMTDFASRSHFMSINRGVIETITLLIRANLLPSSFGHAAPSLGVVVNLLFYIWVLYLVMRNQQTLTRANAILIGCYLAPLLGASWFHHYSLALLPVLFVMRHWIRGLVANLGVARNETHQPERVPVEGIRLILLVVFIWPNFFFWTPGQAVHIFLFQTLGVTDELLVSLANLFSFLLILPVLLRPVYVPEFAWWREQTREEPQQATIPEPCHV